MSLQDKLQVLSKDWKRLYNISAFILTGEQEDESTLDGAVCWILANAIIKLFAGVDPMEQGNDISSMFVYERKEGLPLFMERLREQLIKGHVVMFDYSDPEMHTFVLIYEEGNIYLIDNVNIDETGEPRVQMKSLDASLSEIKAFLSGEAVDFFYGLKILHQYKPQEDDNPLYSFGSYERI